MPGVEDQPPTDEQVARIRQEFQNYINENGGGKIFRPNCVRL